MPRLSKKEREEVKDLLKKGCSQRSVAKKMNTAPSTILRLMKKYEQTGTTDDRPRSRHPRITPVSESSWFECVGQDRPYVCAECGKTFKNMPRLRNHLKIHGDKYDYQCDQCGRGFITLTSFTRHLRIHTGEKPFICEYCARSFADTGTMKTHIRTHTGERPHKCHLCDHACTTAGNLHAHMKVHRDEHGHVPRAANIKPLPSQCVPIFAEKDMLRRAKRRYEKLNGECWPDDDDSSEKESEKLPKGDGSSAGDCDECVQGNRNNTLGSDNEHGSNDEMDSSHSKCGVLIKIETEQGNRDVFTYRDTGFGSDDERKKESEMASNVSMVSQEFESCIQEEPVISSGVAARQEEKSCMEEEGETSSIPEEGIKIRHPFTNRSGVLKRNGDLCSNDEYMNSSQSRYKVVIKQETDIDVSQQVKQFLNSDEGLVREESCAQEESEELLPGLRSLPPREELLPGLRKNPVNKKKLLF